MATVEAKTRHLPFLTAQARVNQRYGVNINRDDFIETAYYIWRDIGNIATTLQEFTAKVPGDGIVELPKNCEFVHSVTSREFQPNSVHHTGSGKYKYDSTGRRAEVTPDISNLSPASNLRTPDEYAFGIQVTYVLGPDWIEITGDALKLGSVTVKYNSIAIDEDGLPLLNDKEVDAIAANTALQYFEKKAFMDGGSKDKIATLEYLKGEAIRLFQAAKVPEKLSDEAIDKALDVKTSWNRKTYGNRFNPLM